MDAREHFRYVAVPNYNEFVQSPSDFRLLGNAILSMNTVAEYLGLDRSGYPPDVSRNERRREAQKIRDDLSGLTDLQVCADTLKHVRNNQPDDVTLSSTGIDPNDPATWKIGAHDLVKVAHNAFATLNGLPELKGRPSSSSGSP
jgi:hypothetical protein